MDIAGLWSLIISVMWDQSYVAGLEKFLRFHNATTILDAAGGTGFPSIELKSQGWDITYSDGSETMLSFFKERLAKERLNLPAYLTSWQTLTKNIPAKFDALLCRGNSLVYVDSWGIGLPSEAAARKNIRKSLEEFHKILNDGGLAYIDHFNENEFGRSHYPFIEEFPEVRLANERIRMIWEVNHNYAEHLRTVKISLTVNNKTEEHILNSYLLPHEELINLMGGAGFGRVEKTAIEGEGNYSVFVGYK